MPGGRDAKRLHGRKEEVYDRMGRQRTSPAPSRNGSPDYPSAAGNVGGMKTVKTGIGATRSIGRRPDECSRSFEFPVGRHDHQFTKISEAASGPPSPRNHAVRYEDKLK